MRITSRSGKTTLALAAVLGFVLALTTAFAAPAEEASQDQAPNPEAVAGSSMPVSLAGVQVAIDPATGKLRPLSPAEARKLAAGLNRMFREPASGEAGYIAMQHRDGMLSAVLGTDYLSFTTVTIDADGTLNAVCSSHPTAAAAALEEE